MPRNWLLLFVPISFAMRWFGANPTLVFAASTLSLIPLAALTETATDSLASYMGRTWGGLLSASLGNAPEIIIGFFALRAGLVDVVKASIAGSIVGNLLFALGLSMFVGGIKHGTQNFNRHIAGMHCALLMLAAAGLVIPAVFHFSSRSVTREISLEISVVLFIAYLGSLAYTLFTNKPMVGKDAVAAELGEAPEPPGGEVGWSRNKALVVLAVVTVALAFMSEMLTDSLEPASKSLRLTPTFAGVFLLALVGNMAQILNSVGFARSNKMDLSLSVTVGSSTQVALVVAPTLVFFGFLLGQDMDLLFSQFEIVGIVMAVFLTKQIIIDGQSNWLEGLMLIAVYAMLGFGFFDLPSPAS